MPQSCGNSLISPLNTDRSLLSLLSTAALHPSSYRCPPPTPPSPTHTSLPCQCTRANSLHTALSPLHPNKLICNAAHTADCSMPLFCLASEGSYKCSKRSCIGVGLNKCRVCIDQETCKKMAGGLETLKNMLSFPYSMQIAHSEFTQSLDRSQKCNIMLWRFLLFCICSEQIVDAKNNWVHLHAFHLSRWCMSLITGLTTNMLKLYMIKHLLYDQENIACITEMRELGLNMKLRIQVLFQAKLSMCLPVEKRFTDSTLFYQ